MAVEQRGNTVPTSEGAHVVRSPPQSAVEMIGSLDVANPN